MDKLKNEKVNNGKTEYRTEQPNTGSKLRKPPSESSEDGLLCVEEKVKSRKSKVESREGSSLPSYSLTLPVDLLRNGAHELGIELSDLQIELLDKFASLLVETNRTLNLTRITEPNEIVTGHYLDSFTCIAKRVGAGFTIPPQGSRVIDIGTGAGFPGIPIKIVRPDIKLTLLDSSLKKLKFIEDAASILGLEDIAFVHSRAEEAGRAKAHREAYDVAFARALADMKVLAELALPLVKVGGILIAQKSEGADDEINSARAIIGQLGGKIEKIEHIKIPYTDITRRLVVIKKIKPTPSEFPRPYSRIAQNKRDI